MHTERSGMPIWPLFEKKEEEQCTTYSELEYEIVKIWEMRKVIVITVVIWTLGTITKHFEKWK